MSVGDWTLMSRCDFFIYVKRIVKETTETNRVVVI